MTTSKDDNSPTNQAGSRPELLTRVATAAVLTPVVLLCAWAGGFWFSLLVAVAIGVGGYEWSRVCDIDRAMSIALLITIGPVLAIALETGGAAASLVVFVLAAISVAGAGNPHNRIWSVLGIGYLGIPLIAILTLRVFPQVGLEYLVFLFGVVWLTDIGAYAAGRTVGGPRLAPSISPGKTWAGAIGGLIVAVAGAHWGAEYMATPPPFGAITAAIFLSIATQCGDLFESWVKRRFGKKDSGAIIPGHGGILDRIDGLLFAAPVMAALTIAHRGAVPLWP